MPWKSRKEWALAVFLGGSGVLWVHQGEAGKGWLVLVGGREKKSFRGSFRSDNRPVSFYEFKLVS